MATVPALPESGGPLDPSRWPTIPSIATNDPQADVKKALYQAQLQMIVAQFQADLDANKATAAANDDRDKSLHAYDYATDQALQQAYLDVTKTTLDRTRGSADFVQKAAAAIGTIYTAAAALTYGVQSGHALPTRGFVPAVFFALAICLATGYVAFITRPADVPPSATAGDIRENQRLRLEGFKSWILTGALNRAWMLRAATVSLGFAVFFLPVAYLNVTDNLTAALAVMAAVAVIVVAFKLK